MVVALFTIPLLINGLGVERFGILMLLWLVVGYFGIFDLGIGRSTTKFVAEAVSLGEQSDIPLLVWTPLALQVVLGIIGGGILALITPWLVEEILNIPDSLQAESRQAFLILSLSLPFILCTSGARGVLEGLRKFGLVNGIRIPASIFTFVAPIGVLVFSQNLFYIAAALVTGRIVVMIIHVLACFRSVPGLGRPQIPERSLAAKLLGYGGWLTVTNVVGVLMALGYIDRFMISALLDLSDVAYYSTSFEAVNKLLLPVAGLLGVLFPVFSAYAKDHQEKLSRLYRQAVKIVMASMLPVIMIILTFAEPGLTIWLGAEFAHEAALILQMTGIGVLISAISSVPMGVLQATGQPAIACKLTLVELPVYILLCFVLTSQWGITGTAATWITWQIVHTTMLFWYCRRSIPSQTGDGRLGAVLIGTAVGGALLAWGLSNVIDMTIRGSLFVLLLGGTMLLVWRFIFDPADKSKIIQLLRFNNVGDSRRDVN